MNMIFTFGHSNRAFWEFLKILQESDIDTLVDIRTFPRSRYCPHFNRNTLTSELSEANITYLFKGKNLGGKGDNVDYEETIDELVEMVRAGKRVCVMCSEASYVKCHRYEMLTPSFIKRGLTVKHLAY